MASISYYQMCEFLNVIKQMLEQGESDKAIKEIGMAVDILAEQDSNELFKIQGDKDGIKILVKKDFRDRMTELGVFDDLDYTLTKSLDEINTSIIIMGKRLKREGTIYLYKQSSEGDK